MTGQSVKIAGTKTVSDWKTFRERLKDTNDTKVWRDAFEQFLLARLTTRYFSPIELLLRDKAARGEGFAVVTILCALIEFLAATLKGLTYRHANRAIEPALNEYHDSELLFIEFLLTELPFGEPFSRRRAKEFYSSVRCALVHEARTKHGWKIKTKSDNDLPIDQTNKIIYYNALYKRIRDFVETYGHRLEGERDLQLAFIRKFNSLCD